MNTVNEEVLLLQRYEAIKLDIKHACQHARRADDSVRLVIVSKHQPEDRIKWLIQAGQREFGENRAEEILSKWQALLQEYPEIKLHFIGQIQSRKIPAIVRFSSMVHSLDRISIAEKIASECSRQNRKLECLIQINTGAEPQKGGIDPALLPEFLKECSAMEPLMIKGIMCLPPVNEDAISHFQLMQKLKTEFNLTEASMGMSDDFDKAIACGATILRIGRRIMGERG